MIGKQLYGRLQESLWYIREKTNFQPKTGIVLGTGLGGLKEDIDIQLEIPYSLIPNFPVSTVQSHEGKLLFGYISGHPVVAMAGRFHYYEGYTMEQVTFPIRVMALLGIERIILSNAAGSVNPNMPAGALVFVRDHINLHAGNPLRGMNDDRLGLRFPDMIDAYDPTLLKHALSIAETEGMNPQTAIYVGLQGPNLETPAEYRFIQIIGGDLVGMSTIPEVIVARHMKMPVLVASVVTNLCYPFDQIPRTTVEEVLEVAKKAEYKLRTVVKKMLETV